MQREGRKPVAKLVETVVGPEDRDGLLVFQPRSLHLVRDLIVLVGVDVGRLFIPDTLHALVVPSDDDVMRAPGVAEPQAVADAETRARIVAAEEREGGASVTGLLRIRRIGRFEQVGDAPVAGPGELQGSDILRAGIVARIGERRAGRDRAVVAQPVETENAPPAQSSDRREISKRQHFRKKALDKQAVKTPDSYRDKMQALKRQHLTREAVRRHLQKQAGGTVLGSGVRLPDTVPVFSGGGIRQAALGRVRTVLQAAWLRLKAILARTIRRAAGSLLALLGAGGVVLLLAMVIGAAAAVIGSPMGILFADESGDPNSIRIAEIVAETNADFGTAINDIVSAHPECSETTMEYDYEDGHTWASYWPEVLAVFAVQNNLNNDGDVVVIDEGKKRLIQDAFWAMHEISAEVEEVTATPEPTEDEPEPEPVTECILHITVSSKSVDALADLYHFTQDQRDILHQLLSEEMRPSLLALCGGIAVADGELCWPLPGHTYISCHFGEVDAFGNAGHRGTDIPAPEGTPILAAHSGTVLVSGWNDSYGNQVLLDNGAGLGRPQLNSKS